MKTVTIKTCAGLREYVWLNGALLPPEQISAHKLTELKEYFAARTAAALANAAPCAQLAER